MTMPASVLRHSPLDMWRKREFECVPRIIDGLTAMHLTMGFRQPGSPKALRATNRFLDYVGLKGGDIALLTVRSLGNEKVAETTYQAGIALGLRLSRRYYVFACYSWKRGVYVVQESWGPLAAQFPISRCILPSELQPHPGNGF